MPRGLTLKHVRKAGAFLGGELAAGEWGLDVTNSAWYFSINGTTVTQLTTGGGATALNDLSDVALSTLAEGHVLSYDATAGQWINRTLAQAGAIASTEKGAANGVATLGADSKIPAAQLPALALTDVHVVVDNVARDALTVQEGDVAIVTSTGESFIYDGAAWQELKTTEAHTHDATHITSGNLDAARMSANAGAALNVAPATTLNNANLVLDAGTL